MSLKDPGRQNYMLKCGHADYSLLHNPDGSQSPACFICGCNEVVEPPDLSTRQARCAYYGTTPRRNESNYGCIGKDKCDCEEPSEPFKRLAFFQHRPTEDFDEFYCGCKSWD